MNAETHNGDIEFLVQLKYVTLEWLYDYLAEAPISNRLRHKWKRIAVAREICRRESQ